MEAEGGLFADGNHEGDGDHGGGLLYGAGMAASGTGVVPRPSEPTVVFQAPPGTTLDSIPAPYEPLSDGELSPQEEKDLAACEAGVDNLRTAFWVAGKSLETMKTANLTRRKHRNFAEYVWDRWEISESHLDRLVNEWRIGEALSKRKWRPLESQVRELVESGFAKAFGDAAAVAAYEGVGTALKKRGQRVTAKALANVVRELPTHLSSANTTVDVLQVREKAQELTATVKKSAPPKSQSQPDRNGAPTPAANNRSGDPAGGDPSLRAQQTETQSPQNGSPDETKQKAANADLDALATAVTCLNTAVNQLQGSLAERALRESPDKARPLVHELYLKLDQLRQDLPVREHS